MPVSQLYTMLAEQERRSPLDDFLGTFSKVGALGKGITDSIEANKQAKTKLSDVLGPDSLISKRYGNMSMKDIKDNSALAALMKEDIALEAATTPQPINVVADDGKGNFTVKTVGTTTKGAKTITTGSVPLISGETGQVIATVPKNAKIAPTPPAPTAIVDETGKPVGVAPAGAKVVPTKTLPASEAEKLALRAALAETLNRIKTGYRPEYVGLKDSLSTKARQFTGAGASPEAGEWLSDLSNYRNLLIKARSGAAVTPQEFSRLMQEVPNERTSDVDFSAKLRSTDRALRDANARHLSVLRQTGYRGFEDPLAAFPQDASDPIAGPAAQFNAKSESPTVNTGTQPATGTRQDTNPDPRKHSGKFLTDHVTGQRYRSNGNAWVPVGR